MLEKTLESPLDCKEIQPVHPKRNQSWIFIGRTDAEAETPILWPPDAKNWLTGKDSDAGKDWRQKEKGMTEDEMVGWHHWLDGHEFEQAAGAGDGQEAWHAAVHGITKSRMQLSNWSELIVWKDSMKKKTTDQYSLWKWVQKSLTKCSQIEFSNISKELYNYNHVGVIPGMQVWFNIWKSVNVISH